MKKNFLFFAFLSCCCSFPAWAATFTNITPVEYQNTEYYDHNGKAFTAIGAHLAYTGTGGVYTGFSGDGVTVAIIDSGTMLDHEELQNKISSLFEPAFNLYASEHGTHTAGIVAAEKNDNDVGMHGVAYGASLLPFSILLEGSCDNPLFCMNWNVAYEILALDEYDSVKIVNNSWGTVKDSVITVEQLKSSAAIAKKLVDKGKLIVASAGNEMQLEPSSFPAKMAAYDSSTALNLISVVAYDPDKLPSDTDFIAEYTNLASSAKKWSLAAPGTVYSSIAYINDSPKYSELDGTSMAAPMVSGAAALVSEAFPYMDGKQIADVLFSTAFKKEDLEEPNLTPGLSPYMIQDDGKNQRFLFFTDNSQGMSYDEAKTDAGIVCEGTMECNEVTFEDVFGQGLLNVGDAVKGLKYLDADRLTASDYNESLNQYFYTVNTQGYNSTWSNDIEEKRNTSAHEDAAVGLKKQGAGSLTLAGTNTFEGVSVVEAGTLSLTGSMTGAVTADGGIFALNGGNLDGALTVNAGAQAQIYAGTLGGSITNQGTFNAANGTATGNVVNEGTFNVTGNFNATGSFQNESVLKLQNAGTLHGNLQNASSGKIIVTQGSTLEATSALENNGVLSGFGTINGTVNNNASGSVATSLNIGTLISSGNILLTADQSGNSIAPMHVDSLNISGGKVSLNNDNVVYENGRTYTIISSASLPTFNNFEEQTYLSSFILATTSREDNNINTRIDYLRMSENAIVSSFSAEEKQVVSILDKIFIDQRQTNFGRFYYYSAEGLRKQVNLLRSKVQPVQNEQLPLTKVMASQVHAHLFANTMVRDAGTVRQPHVPMQQYRGKYYRGRSGGNTAKNQKVWGQFLGGVFKEDGNSALNKDDITTKTIGAMFGYDYEFSENFLLGLTTGVASAKLKQDEDKIEVKDYRAGFYTGSRFGRVTLNTLAMGGIQQYKSSRFMQLGGMATSNIADFNGYSAEFDVNLGYDFARLPYRDHSFYLRSYIGANVNYIHQDAYKEKENSFLALGVSEVHDTSVSVSPGLTLGYLFSEAVITADVGYQRLLSGDSVQRSAYFLADVTKSTFSSLSADTDKDFFNAGVGFKTNLTRNWQAHFWAGTRFSKKTEALNLSATFAYTF
ncbi:MAG: S8 family serine peptidase [Alphaproteobacteria bacterium]|nr:S8 family serine peptidase [Alphaproteobacteria bacterium]